MASNKTRSKWLGANLCRFLLSLTFFFSGVVKLIDPRGTQYKIEDYSVLFGFYAYVTPLLALSLAVALAMLEFYLGFNLFFGIRRRTTTRLTVLVLAVMTPITLYLALSSTHMDCGCFGDAVHLTNWQTFAKNIVLLGAAIVAMRSYRHLTRFISERNQWLLSLYSLVFALFLALYNISYLPVMDFRPYKVGTDLPKAIMQDWEKMPDEMQYADFSILSAEGEDITLEWLEQPGYKFLLVAPFLETADDGSMEQYNTLYDYCQSHGYSFLAVTSSGQEAIDRWKDLTGAEYEFAQADGTMLKTVIRSNPGLLMLHDGVVYNKWSANGLPTVDEQTAPLEESKLGQMHRNSRLKALYRLMLWFLVPLILWTLIDRIWVGRKLYKRHIIHKRINTLLPQTKSITDMRKKIVAGNWKMNLNLQEGVALATELKGALAADKPNCDVVICTPFIHLATVAGVVEGTVIGLGAENCADKEKGAYTGEVSAAQVKSTGAQYVILGHSERRAYYGETPEILKEKVNLALANGLKVIFCIGEVLEEREAGKQNEVVGAQLADSLFDLTDEQFANIILAYEPVWAIGTGKTATAEQAQDMHEFIRGVIAGRFGEAAAENVSILYGGSCKPSNAKEIFSKPDVDGGLIGGAALKCADFMGIIDAWK